MLSNQQEQRSELSALVAPAAVAVLELLLIPAGAQLAEIADATLREDVIPFIGMRDPNLVTPPASESADFFVTLPAEYANDAAYARQLFAETWGTDLVDAPEITIAASTDIALAA